MISWPGMIRKPAYFALLFVSVIVMAFEASGQSRAEKSLTHIYWSDADSGYLKGRKFRLKDVDGPETRSLRQRGGAKCEAEIVLGYEHKAAMKALTQNKTIVETGNFGKDIYGRELLSLSVDGEDLRALAIQKGILRSWRFSDKNKPLEPKPDWCAQAN